MTVVVDKKKNIKIRPGGELTRAVFSEANHDQRCQSGFAAKDCSPSGVGERHQRRLCLLAIAEAEQLSEQHPNLLGSDIERKPTRKWGFIARASRELAIERVRSFVKPQIFRPDDLFENFWMRAKEFVNPAAAIE